MRAIAFVIILAAFVGAVGCATPKGETGDEKRAYILKMQDDAIARLEQENPGMRAQIDQAPGYGCFSNISTKILFVGGGNGYGVVTDNKTGKSTFMKMAEVGVGLGAGIKDFKVIFVFNDAATLHEFVEDGWEFGGEADAAAVHHDDGGAVGADVSVNSIDIYQFTDRGIMLNAMVTGTKYWGYSELN